MRIAVLICLILGVVRGEDAQKFAIAGTIVNALTGQPLRRAAVGLQYMGGGASGPVNASTNSDAGGHFVFSDLPAGQYLLWGDKHGFARQSYGQEGQNGSFKPVTAGPAQGEITLALTPLGHISGKIDDENGNPVMGINVQVLRAAINGGRRQILPAGSGITNDLGEYRIASLPAGRYYVSASGKQDAELMYPRTYYGGSTELLSASAIELSTGGGMNADIHLYPTHAQKIIGRITNIGSGHGYFVTLNHRGGAAAGGEGYPVRIQPDGSFEVRGVAPGAYVLTAGSFDGASRQTASQDIVVADGDVEGLVLTLAKSPEITGTIDFEQRDNIAPLNLRSIGISLRPGQDGFHPALGARIDERTFTIPDVQPGDYFLVVTVPEPYYLKSALTGGRDLLSEGLIVSPGSTSAPVSLVIAANGGQIEGSVLAGNEPAADSAIMLIPRDASTPGREKLTRADVAGRFQFTAVSPGDYLAYAWRDIPNIEYGNPEVLRRYSGTSVSVLEGAKQRVELRLNPE